MSADVAQARRFWYKSSVVPGQPAYRRRHHGNREAAVKERRQFIYSAGLWVNPLKAEGGRIRKRDICKYV